MEYFTQLKKEMKTSSENKNKEERNRNKINYIIDTPTLKKSNSTINIISKPSALEKRLLNYQKQIKQKKFENENISLMNSKLKNRLHLYYNKFNGLFFSLKNVSKIFLGINPY